MDEDDAPKRKLVEKPDLEVMSVAALQDYIAELEGEIARTKAAIDRKRAHRGAAEGFFKS